MSASVQGKNKKISSVLACALTGAGVGAIFSVIRPSGGFAGENQAVYLAGLLGLIVGAIVSTFLIDKKKNKIAMFLSAVLSLALILGGAFIGNTAVFSVCAALFCAGAGIAVTSALYTVQSWLALRKGLACALVLGVAGTVDGIVLSMLKNGALDASQLTTFIVLGIVCAVIFAVSAVLMNTADSEYMDSLYDPQKVRILRSSIQFTTKQMVSGKHIKQLLVIAAASFAFMCMVCEKITALTQVKQISEYQADMLSVYTAFVFAAGCIVLGVFSDWLRRKLTFMLTFLIMGIGSWIAYSFVSDMFVVGAVTAAFACGGASVCLPAVIVDFYGEENSGKNIGVFAACTFFVMGVLFVLSGVFMNTTNGLSFPFEVSLLLAVVGLVIAVILGRPSVDLKYKQEALDEENKENALEVEEDDDLIEDSDDVDNDDDKAE